jgi:hypothetical protein
MGGLVAMRHGRHIGIRKMSFARSFYSYGSGLGALLCWSSVVGIACWAFLMRYFSWSFLLFFRLLHSICFCGRCSVHWKSACRSHASA